MVHTYILDAGVLFSNWTSKIPEGIFVTTNTILDEVRNRPSKIRTEILTLIDRLHEEYPSSESLDAVRKAATKTGDRSVLSDADIEIIALAHSKKSVSESVTLVSTDLAVLNTARHLGIEILDPSGRFKHEIMWSLKCPACNHQSKYKAKQLECPICGTLMKRVVSRKRKSQ